MTASIINRTKEAAPYIGIVLVSLVALQFTGYFDPLPERSPTSSDGVFVYYGPEGETVPARGAEETHVEIAKTALEEADYFGAFAVGPKGRTGFWTGAYSPKVARAYAIAACGSDCRIVAERLPLHRDPDRSEPVMTTPMARNLAVRWPFSNDVIALGGSNAWGYQSKPPGKTGRKSAMRDAAEECEGRRAKEMPPAAEVSQPCKVQTLNDIEDLRPKPTLYPAAYTVELMDLAPVSETQIFEVEGAPGSGLFGPYLPPYLYGARATNGASAKEVVRGAGWAKAGERAALEKCNAARKPGEVPCVISHRRMPDPSLPEGTLAVRPDLFESFKKWEATGGAGAFAVSPYGVWGFSYDLADTDVAIQKAADWCWYYTRKNWEYRQVNRAFLDPGLTCRVVAVREP